MSNPAPTASQPGTRRPGSPYRRSAAWDAGQAKGGLDIDTAVYDSASLADHSSADGLRKLGCPRGFFGRDPGRTEVELREPFIGRGGSLV